MNGPSYVLMTTARNEAALISKTIMSVVNQSTLPKRWIIVSDGSTDATDHIVKQYADQYTFIEFMRLEDQNNRNFASQAHALNAAYETLRDDQFDYVGSLDADIELDSTYYEVLVGRMEMDPAIGIGGGYSHEWFDGRYVPSPYNRPDFVPGAVQFFRRACFDVNGRFLALPYGGLDTFAEMTARFEGWEVRSYEDLIVKHNRPVGHGDSLLKSRFKAGLMDNSLGCSFGYTLVKYLRRIGSQPVVVGSLARLAGFLWYGATRRSRPVPPDFVEKLRQFQKQRVKSVIQS